MQRPPPWGPSVHASPPLDHFPAAFDLILEKCHPTLPFLCSKPSRGLPRRSHLVWRLAKAQEDPPHLGVLSQPPPPALFGLGVLCSTHHCLELFIACCLISPPSPVPTNSPSYGENKRPGAETLPSHCHVPTQHLKRACRMGFCMREGISCSFIGNFNFLYEPSPQLRLLFFDRTACHVVS